MPADARAAVQSAPPGYWFPAKTYGWGWGPPLTWQGWVTVVAYVAAVAAVGVIWPPPRHMLGFGIGTTAATLAMIVICWRTGEPPRWRWGK